MDINSPIPPSAARISELGSGTATNEAPTLKRGPPPRIA